MPDYSMYEKYEDSLSAMKAELEYLDIKNWAVPLKDIATTLDNTVVTTADKDELTFAATPSAVQKLLSELVINDVPEKLPELLMNDAPKKLPEGDTENKAAKLSVLHAGEQYYLLKVIKSSTGSTLGAVYKHPETEKFLSIDKSGEKLGKICKYFSTAEAKIYSAAGETSSKANTPDSTIKSSLLTTDYTDLSLTPIVKAYGGMHEKCGYKDKFGREWLAKYYSSDDNAFFRLDAEHYANVIGRLFGFPSAETYVGVVSNRESIIQRIVPNKGSLSGLTWQDLTKEQLVSVMSEHVLDWLIANHDSYGENLLILDDSTIMGIDKGQFSKHLHDDRLAMGYLPPENPIPVWYDNVYDAIVSNYMPDDLAEAVATGVLEVAYKVAHRFTDKYASLLSEAFNRRSFWPDEYPNKSSFIQAMLDRKDGIYEAFKTLYTDMFKLSSRDTSFFDTLSFDLRVGEAYVEIGPEFIQSIEETGPFGRSLLFNTSDLEDFHAIFTEAVQKDGNKSLLVYTKVRKEADSRLSSFASSLFTGEYKSKVQHSFPTQAVKSIYDNNVAYIKTLHTHCPNGPGSADGAYNTNTISTAQEAAQNAQSLLHQVTSAYNMGRLPSTVTLSNFEQALFLKDALKNQLDIFYELQECHAEGVTFVSKYPDITVSLPTYVPSKNITSNANGTIVEVYVRSGGDTVVFRTSGGGYFLAHKSKLESNLAVTDGKYSVLVGLTKDDWDSIIGLEVKWYPLYHKDKGVWHDSNGNSYSRLNTGDWLQTKFNFKPVDDVYVLSDIEMRDAIAENPSLWRYAGEDFVEEEMSLVTDKKVIQVLHSAVCENPYVYNGSLNKLEERDVKPDHLNRGGEYVFIWNNITVRYRSWYENDTPIAQKGLLTVEVRNWDRSVNTLKNIIDIWDIIGIKVLPADETSLELGYWRLLSNILSQRADKKSSSYKPVFDSLQEFYSKPSVLPMREELEFLKNVWRQSINDRVDSADWRPHFDSLGGITASGHPYWLRPDCSLEELKNIYKGSLPIHTGSTAFGSCSVCNGESEDEDDECYCDTGEFSVEKLSLIAYSGHLISTEERIRAFNFVGLLEGCSSSSDQEKGSSDFVFTRQNYGNGVTGVPTHGAFIALIDPSAVLRIHNYSFDSDYFGCIESRAKKSKFNPKQMFSHFDGGNELLIKKSAPIAAIVLNQSTVEELDKSLNKYGRQSNIPIISSSKIFHSDIEGVWG